MCCVAAWARVLRRSRALHSAGPSACAAPGLTPPPPPLLTPAAVRAYEKRKKKPHTDDAVRARLAAFHQRCMAAPLFFFFLDPSASAAVCPPDPHSIPTRDSLKLEMEIVTAASRVLAGIYA